MYVNVPSDFTTTCVEEHGQCNTTHPFIQRLRLRCNHPRVGEEGCDDWHPTLFDSFNRMGLDISWVRKHTHTHIYIYIRCTYLPTIPFHYTTLHNTTQHNITQHNIYSVYIYNPRSYRSKGSSPGKKCLKSFGPQPFGIDFQRVQPNRFKPTTKLQFPGQTN